MFTPAAFKATDSDTFQLIDNSPFGILISVSENFPVMTHLPLLRNGNTLFGHLARENPHARLLDGPVSVVFQGPHTYISPRWYVAGKKVPTWNYMTAHISGVCKTIADDDRKRVLMDALVTRFEDGLWAVDWADPYYERLMTAVTFFEISIEYISATLKMSQNHSANDVSSVIDALRASGRAADADVARAMELTGSGRSE